MKNIIPIIVVVLLFFSCKKESNNQPFFKPTDHWVATYGSGYGFSVWTNKYDFSLVTKEKTAKILLSDSNLIVKKEQLEKASLILADTLKFKWQSWKSVNPFPETDCQIIVFHFWDGYNKYDPLHCSIGNDSYTDEILLELSNTFEGEAKLAFDELIAALREIRQ